MAEVIVALDVAGGDAALELVRHLSPQADFFKVGLELFVRAGPAIVNDLRALNRRVFLDLKLHDIPNTVRAAAEAAADLDVELLTVHAAGGARMIGEARAALEGGRTRLLAVTVLTSMAGTDLSQVWGREGVCPEEEVTRLAAWSVGNGAHGVVCSPHEAAGLRRDLGPDALIVTPGIRLAGDGRHDHARIATPRDAQTAGADFLVVGRSITRASDPRVAFAEIQRQLEAP